MFSQTAEYALRAVCHLAFTAPSSCTTEEIASSTKVPMPYLSKVLQGLARAGVVRSQRGVGGGISLVKRPEELTILEVVSAVDPIARINTCPLGLKAHGTNLCPLHRRMDNATASVEEALRRTTLAEVIAEPSASIPLCESPANRPAPKPRIE